METPVTSVTLIQTRKLIEIKRVVGTEEITNEEGKTETKDVIETVGSFEISISDPAFVKKSEKLADEISSRGFDDLDFDFVDQERQARVLLESSIIGGKEVVDELLGERPDIFNTMLLLNAVMQQVNVLDPGRRMIESLNQLVPDMRQLEAEALAKHVVATQQKKKKRPRGKVKR